MTDQIIATLATSGPLPLWRLRELLQVGERPLYARVARLRNDGVVKRIGTCDRRVFWAMATYSGPPPEWRTLNGERRRTARPVRRRPRACVPTLSWWIEAQHENFAATAAQRACEMLWGINVTDLTPPP